MIYVTNDRIEFCFLILPLLEVLKQSFFYNLCILNFNLTTFQIEWFVHSF